MVTDGGGAGVGKDSCVTRVVTLACLYSLSFQWIQVSLLFEASQRVVKLLPCFFLHFLLKLLPYFFLHFLIFLISHPPLIIKVTSGYG